MNIVISTSNIACGGGISVYVYTLANILANSGFSVHVITTHSSGKENEKNAHNLHKNVVLHSTSSRNVVLRYFFTWNKLRCINPDVIINNYNGVVQYLLPLLSRKTKVIHVIHGVIDDFYRIASVNASLVSAWVTPSPAVANQFNAYTGNRYKQKVFVIPHGVPATSFELNKTSQVPELTFIGVLYEHKGAHILPDIIKGIAEGGTPFHFNIVGDGLLREQLEKSLSSEIECGLVHFTGKVPTSKVNEILSRTSVFVYPTQLDSFGLVIAEAMMSGAVPVVSRISGVTDSIVNTEENGYLVDKESVREFVDCVVRLLENTSLLEKMKKSARMTAEEQFSVFRMRDCYVELIHNLGV